MQTFSLDAILGPQVFELTGIDESFSSDLPSAICSIRVDRIHVFEESIIPEFCKIRYWYRCNNKVIYAYDIEPKFTKRNGKLYFNAVKYLEKLGFPTSYIQTNDLVQFEKRSTYNCSFISTCYGIAKKSPDLFNNLPDFYKVYFAPGAMKICGHEIQNINWYTSIIKYTDEYYKMKHTLERTLSATHEFTANTLLKQLSDAKLLDEEPLSFEIQTDKGYFGADFNLKKCLLVQLGGKSFEIRLMNSRRVDVLKVILKIMQDYDENTVGNFITKLRFMTSTYGSVPSFNFNKIDLIV